MLIYLLKRESSQIYLLELKCIIVSVPFCRNELHVLTTMHGAARNLSGGAANVCRNLTGAEASVCMTTGAPDRVAPSPPTV